MTTLDNILTFIKLKGMSKRLFEIETGLPNGTLNNSKKRSGDLSDENVQKIVDKYSKELYEAGFVVIDMKAFGKTGGYSVIKQAAESDLSESDLALKKEYQIMVEQLKAKLREDHLPYRNEDIADILGYNGAYFSTLTGTSGKVTANHIHDLRLNFPDVFENQVLAKTENISLTTLDQFLRSIHRQIAINHEEISKKIDVLVEREAPVRPVRPRNGTHHCFRLA